MDALGLSEMLGNSGFCYLDKMFFSITILAVFFPIKRRVAFPCEEQGKAV